VSYEERSSLSLSIISIRMIPQFYFHSQKINIDRTTVMSTTKPIAIIAGVGSGTGAALARRFAQSYPVVLLARDPSNFESLASEINQAGGQAIGISMDVSDEKSVEIAFMKIKEVHGAAPVAAVVFNASTRPARKPFLESTAEDFKLGYEVSVYVVTNLISFSKSTKHLRTSNASSKGAFLIAQHTIPRLLAHVQSSLPSDTYPPTLIFTGATASVKSNAQMSSFSTAKFALRALSLSLAKEFGSQGVHVAHAVIDGMIDTEFTKEWLKGQPAEASIASEDIAAVYWELHTQGRRGWVNEADLRSMLEKW
jgi:NAD(P)-dependent dehydrogenase (short-subunit alcohol dehydrogenase family)